MWLPPPRYVRGSMPNQLTPYHATLEQALKTDTHRIKQNRRASKALFEQIKADGYAASYSRVTDFTREWRGREDAQIRCDDPAPASESIAGERCVSATSTRAKRSPTDGAS